MNRRPAVAGQFYPADAQSLRHLIQSYSPVVEEKIAALGVMVPHAGYVYSGAIAGAVFARVRIPSKVILLGPNHHGLGARAALFPAGTWHTPLGSVAIDEDLAGELLTACPLLTADPRAHQAEHSLEVQIPFLQVLAPDCRIVPLCLGHLSLEELLELGAALARILAAHPGEVLMVASSDMTHYEPGAVAREKDERALQRIIALDPEGLYRTVRDGRISMCGVLPMVAMLEAARLAGASRATLVRYGNSGDITGDQSSVVGYAGVVLS